MDEVPVFFLVTREFEAIRRQERVLYELQRLGPKFAGFGLGWCTLHLRGETIERLRQQPSNIAALGMGGTRAISKTSFGRTARFGNSLPVFSHLAALEDCLVKEQGATGLIGVTTQTIPRVGNGN